METKRPVAWWEALYNPGRYDGGLDKDYGGREGDKWLGLDLIEGRANVK